MGGADIGAGEGRSVAFHLGDLAVGLERVEVGAPKLDGEDVLAHLFSPLPVEAILPASVLARYELVLNMAAGRMILAPPGSIAPQGVAVPIRVDADTGVAAVDAEIAGERHLLALDAGASFTWLRGSLVRRWLAAHPDWLRAEGAVGLSNMGLTGLDIERRGTLLRLPKVTLGGRVSLTDLGAFGTAPLLCELCDRLAGELF